MKVRWDNLTILEGDGETRLFNDKEEAKYLAEFLLTNGMDGVFFDYGGEDHEDSESADTWGPVGRFSVDWTGFLKWAKPYLSAETIKACREEMKNFPAEYREYRRSKREKEDAN